MSGQQDHQRAQGQQRDLDHDRARIADIAREAGRALMGYFRKDPVVREKPYGSLVSEADEHSERMIREAIHKAFPGEPVLGEEEGLPEDPEGGAWWAVDPLDGTSNFVSGIPLFCVSIARMERGHATHAAIYAPVTDEMWTAARGGGAWLGGQRVTLGAEGASPAAILGVQPDLARRYPALLERLEGNKVRCLGSAALEVAYVATGRFEAIATRRVWIWDVAAGALLVEEAGGRATNPDGRPFYPLPFPPTECVTRRLPLVAGTEGAVARLLVALR